MEYMKYTKINTLWKRDNKTLLIKDGQLSRPEFVEVEYWDTYEKIEGMNTKISWKNGIKTFGGKTDNAQIPEKLFKTLEMKFPDSLLEDVFGLESDVTIFGEGYGANIEGGGNYTLDNDFILFDININGWWLLKPNIDKIATQLSVETVPYLGNLATHEIISLVKSKPQSTITSKEKIMEGVVCRTPNMLFMRNGEPLMWKLKVKDYTKLEAYNKLKT